MADRRKLLVFVAVSLGSNPGCGLIQSHRGSQYGACKAIQKMLLVHRLQTEHGMAVKLELGGLSERADYRLGKRIEAAKAGGERAREILITPKVEKLIRGLGRSGHTKESFEFDNQSGVACVKHGRLVEVPLGDFRRKMRALR